MNQATSKNLEELVIFAKDNPDTKTAGNNFKSAWKVLIVDDEKDVHEITRIALRDYTFNGQKLELISAYCEDDVKKKMQEEPGIALIILDVVMERDNSGLLLVEYIRNELKNLLVRIVLRTGQPGKAPEYEVISRYDINDYKTKPDLTAQKLFTMITACLRSYDNLKTIERNTIGLENIIHASSEVFQHHSYSTFGTHVLNHLFNILNIDIQSTPMDSAYFIGMPESSILLMAGTGCMKDKKGAVLDDSMPPNIVKANGIYKTNGGELIDENEYTGVFRTREGFTSILYLNGINSLSSIEKNLMRIYANNIAIGFDNISLAREIINTQKEVILTLGEIVETRSQETANHVTRVAEICYLLARKYGMDEDTCEMLRLASPMHDVGKIAVPEAILNKPDKLTDTEFEIIKDHARTGYEILKKSNRPIMKTAAIIALQHHERWDGNGYPQGLSQNNIHIFGRIAAIADVFDALSHKRCYKDAWETEKILDFFKSESGKHFDAQLVDIFISHIEEFTGINRRFPE
ncbi:MAG: DUF3369 domain-containing protein [Proteobacteria bacterium]|nr:DUF3369 domain-containing protein [Pseudomonadota bacterium]MBU1386374.1 DUF3369 domain-containing protein [Pseudomonadota bacterium]MBU1544485.1 DUF3369 domain-containing protein [Pseudomonadota bacterium]MBU2480336.1 DUF3369 domain-containing protein [Pseudomonadota bacterium]